MIETIAAMIKPKNMFPFISLPARPKMGTKTSDNVKIKYDDMISGIISPITMYVTIIDFGHPDRERISLA